ncbi:hypothetical protein ACX9MO_16045 [Pseudooceanicola sp. 502str34]
MDDYYDLGPHGMPVTTASPLAQLWFDRGLNWVYGYNHVEAVACFHKALEADPACAMAWWGVAYASGPNYNLPWVKLDPVSRAKALAVSFDATQEALSRLEGVTQPEADLIRALAARYPQRDPIEDLQPWVDDFANAMRRVSAAHPDHKDLRTIFAEALLNRTPWAMWLQAERRPNPLADTLECQAVLETGMAQPGGMAHPGLLHLYVHLMEMSPTPEKALKAGDVLRHLVPDAGHLVHMPTHIDVQCGAYQDALFWNQRAIAADLRYFDREGGMNYYTGYRMHDYHFAIYGALFLGQMQPALEALRGMEATFLPELLLMESPPMAEYFEAYLAMEPHVLIRFGQWRELIAMAPPVDPALRATLHVTLLYGKALAHAALGEVEAALAGEAAFLAALEQMPLRRLHNNLVSDLMQIAREMLRGEILYRQRDYTAAFAHLREAVRLDDTLPYDEPWGWMQPARHALGALLYEQGHVPEAEAVYRADLGLAGDLPRGSIHPDNVWSLKGLHDCLEAQGESVERRLIRQKLDFALARADAGVAASCACAQSAMLASGQIKGPSCCAAQQAGE